MKANLARLNDQLRLMTSQISQEGLCEFTSSRILCTTKAEQSLEILSLLKRTALNSISKISKETGNSLVYIV